jgi:very-short-patch-repair endonuclease
VAVSRARDRLVLVRSVRREDLKPADLKARLIAHFDNPMPVDEIVRSEGLAACESDFERDVMETLLDRGYRVQPQVGALGYRIDMVVEGLDGRRLAVECDGDRFHGPEQWREDMRRQRVLERVGWQFWRCFASSYYRDPDGVIAELVNTLSRLGIEPISADAQPRVLHKFTEHRTASTPLSDVQRIAPAGPTGDEKKMSSGATAERSAGVAVSDRVVLLFADDKRRISVRLAKDDNNLDKGVLSVASPLGQAILGAEEGDEVEFHLDDSKERRVLVEAILRSEASQEELPDLFVPDEVPGDSTSAATRTIQ